MSQRTKEISRFIKVAEKSELANVPAKIVNVDGRNIALFRVKDEFFATANLCLHRGGPLGEGVLSGSLVTCPWHGWKFDVKTGSFTVIPTLKVPTYKVKEENGAVLIEIPQGHFTVRPDGVAIGS